MLISAADNFEYESEQAISRLISFLEPAMIIVMAVIVGMIMIAVMLPLLNMYAEIEASEQCKERRWSFQYIFQMNE